MKAAYIHYTYVYMYIYIHIYIYIHTGKVKNGHRAGSNITYTGPMESRSVNAINYPRARSETRVPRKNAKLD